MKALNPFAPFWYTPREDADNPSPTKFKLQGLNGEQMGFISPEFILGTSPSGSPMITGITGKGVVLALDYGLLDWENFANDAGPIAFARANFSLMPYALRTELAFQIVLASHVPDSAKKT